MKLKKYNRQNGRMIEYRLCQGIVSMHFIAWTGYPRAMVAAALKAMRLEVRREIGRLKP